MDKPKQRERKVPMLGTRFVHAALCAAANTPPIAVTMAAMAMVMGGHFGRSNDIFFDNGAMTMNMDLFDLNLGGTGGMEVRRLSTLGLDDEQTGFYLYLDLDDTTLSAANDTGGHSDHILAKQIDTYFDGGTVLAWDGTVPTSARKRKKDDRTRHHSWFPGHLPPAMIGAGHGPLQLAA